MLKLALVFVVSIGLLFSLVDVEAQQLIELSAKPSKSNFSSDETVIITGNLQDSDGMSIDNADIVAGFPDGSIKTKTNSDGSFELRKDSLGQGVYSVGVIASKNDFGTVSTNIKIVITTNPTAQLSSDLENTVNSISEGTENIPKTVNNLSGSITEGITKNPVSEKILKQIEQFKKQQEEIKENQEKQKMIEKNRQISNQRMEQDLESLKKSHDASTPENAFARFVDGLDSTVQQVFWEQFKLTQEKHNEAQNAREDALANGSTSEDAMKQFQRKAALSRSQIIEHNEQLNIEYGNSDEKVQPNLMKKAKYHEKTR